MREKQQEGRDNVERKEIRNRPNKERMRWKRD
jgi:hypothetical protein